MSRMIYLFGPQVPVWSARELTHLQSTLQADSRFRAWSDTLSELASLQLAVTEALAKDETHVQDTASRLAAFANGSLEFSAGNLANSELGPLTILDQAIRLFDTVTTEPINDSVSDVQGFCLGILSAAAYAGASDFDALECNILAAIRLAFCIGLVIDIDNLQEGELEAGAAVSVSWEEDGRQELDAVLQSFPEAYISCFTDRNIATITVAKRNEPSIIFALKEANCKVSRIGLKGRYHHGKHLAGAQMLKSLAAQDPSLRLPHASNLRLPVRSTFTGLKLREQPLHELAIDCILSQTANWYDVLSKVVLSQTQEFTLVSFGRAAGAIPRSMSWMATKSDNDLDSQRVERPTGRSNDIAIIGVACRLPQADSLEEFWKLLSEGRIAFGGVPPDRYNPDEVLRGPKPVKAFSGNFIRDAGAFDHRFFGISGRESKTMDPQQRLAMQVSYEALESSGYFRLPLADREKSMGCYLGVGANDYDDNVASVDANAFSAVGTLRAFISGRISQFFGINGPSLTIDTACSSSAVAIHTACKAILGGECVAAVAGGVNVITSPKLHQNLAAASFLSTDGPSRAFDASASGYCRGEGSGMLVLKKLAEAERDGDPIYGLIAGSAVNQNSNRSPITVPDSDSQSSLCNQVLRLGNVEPSKVTYVEAHGTGTQVGDPKEYEGIRMTFAKHRSDPLYLGSVKDNIGHCEAASGVAAVVKVLLMMQYDTIVKQVGFSRLNPKIVSTPQDQITLPTANAKWSRRDKLALINNYGAGGNNAALLVRGYSKSAFPTSGRRWHPILLSASSANHLRSYMDALKHHVTQSKSSLEHIASALSVRQNVDMNARVGFAAESKQALVDQLSDVSVRLAEATKPPIVLVFGGQTGKVVHVSKDLYDQGGSFSANLDACDRACTGLGLPSIFPSIFLGQSTDNLVLLHCMLLSTQVASAKTRIQSGIAVKTLVGHSFGQISALCVAGSLSLEDGFKFVSERARLIEASCGQEPGAMLAVDGSRAQIEEILRKVNTSKTSSVDIACCNGVENFVLAGPRDAIERAKLHCGAVKHTQLKNTHAYHSGILDCIMEDLIKLTHDISLQPPSIPVETCSQGGSWTTYDDPTCLARHTRETVFFTDAIERITSLIPSALWLEAGSASPIIPMVRRILDMDTSRPTNYFIPIDLGANHAKSLATGICELWNCGLHTQNSPFSSSFKQSYPDILALPPYQFEKHHHWTNLDLSYPRPVTESDGLQTRSFKDSAKQDLVFPLQTSQCVSKHEFGVRLNDLRLQLAIKGHAVAGHPLCPASAYIELVTACGFNLVDLDASSQVSQVEALRMSAALTLDDQSVLSIEMSDIMDAENIWSFRVLSKSINPDGRIRHTLHATGVLRLIARTLVDGDGRLDLLHRMGRKSQVDRILGSTESSRVSGSVVYDIFGDVVDYAPYYRGVQTVAVQNFDAAAIVTIPSQSSMLFTKPLCDLVALDNFLQVAGIHVNCLRPREADQVFMCTSVDKVLAIHPLGESSSRAQEQFYVSTRYDEEVGNGLSNDIFVFDIENRLNWVILGAKFQAVSMRSLNLSLARLNTRATFSKDMPSGLNAELSMPKLISQTTARQSEADSQSKEHLGQETTRAVIQAKDVSELLSSIIGVPSTDISPSSTLDELGVDSLLATEVLREIQIRFLVDLSRTELLEAADISALAEVLTSNLTSDVSQTTISTTGTSRQGTGASSPAHSVATSTSTLDGPLDPAKLNHATHESSLALIAEQTFRKAKQTYDRHSVHAGFEDYYENIYPAQTELVVHYVLTAFRDLGCDISMQKAFETTTVPIVLNKHKSVMAQLHRILAEAGLIELCHDEPTEHGRYRRTAKAVPVLNVDGLESALLEKPTVYFSQTQLLKSTGRCLADCLRGHADPIDIIFGTAAARTLLEDVYTNAPMFKVGTLVLSDYLTSVLKSFAGKRRLRILEVGGGTGGTTKYLMEQLEPLQDTYPFEYTFTDLSGSLVQAAKRKFKKYSSSMKFMTLNIENEPEECTNTYDIILSTNCIHATRDLSRTLTNIRRMLCSDGLLCLVELTRNLFWFDLVFGLLEGWWLFEDGRKHGLASETLWREKLIDAGFHWIDWTDTQTKESKLLRVITTSPSTAAVYEEAAIDERKGEVMETLRFQSPDGVDLFADIYFPSSSLPSMSRKLSVALMIHGGGHVMLSRKDINPEHIQSLLARGFLPVSIDYRLCPETTLAEGPMADVASAFIWVRQTLPTLRLARDDISVDSDRIVAVGWSTGGQLAMSLAWTIPSLGMRGPDAILVFYCPSDYEDAFWTTKNIPRGSESALCGNPTQVDDLIWESLSDKPLTEYKIAPKLRALGRWMAVQDPRSRLALWMNWHGRTLNVLCNGLDINTRTTPPTPSLSQVRAISPLAHICGEGQSNRYQSPTFIIHPRNDDLIPWQQAERTYNALCDAGVDSELRILADEEHLFDIVPGWQKNAAAREAVEEGFAFLVTHSN